MSATTIRLWFIRDTIKARLYSKVPMERNPKPDDYLWVPFSIIEHTTKRGNEHEVKLPDWFIQMAGL